VIGVNRSPVICSSDDFMNEAPSDRRGDESSTMPMSTLQHDPIGEVSNPLFGHPANPNAGPEVAIFKCQCQPCGLEVTLTSPEDPLRRVDERRQVGSEAPVR
jgi:hypothetical protein